MTTKAARQPLPGKPQKPHEKRTWEKPRIKTGQLFESNSLSCGKSNMMMEPCQQNPQTS
jgi:hypothetical protein